MGVLHSKPRCRRRRTSKRQSPEGGHCSAAVQPPVVLTRQCVDTCPCNKPRFNEAEETQNFKSCAKELATPVSLPSERPSLLSMSPIRSNDVCENLRVNLPPMSTPAICDSCQRYSSNHNPPLRANVSAEGDNEWTISFSGDDAKGVGWSRDEEIRRLMLSIRNAVDSEMGKYTDKKKFVRVTLSVTPETASGKRIANEDDLTTSAALISASKDGDRNAPEKCQSCHERRRCSAQRSTSKDSRSITCNENVDRQRHYDLIPGMEDSKVAKASESKPANAVRSPVSPRSCNRPVKHEVTPRSRDHSHRSCTSRRCSRCRRGGNRHRYQSPFDQRFQEAMYLRLSALQRDSAREAEITKGQRDESRNNTTSSTSSSDTDSEYSGDDDGAVLSEKDLATGHLSQIFDPLGSKVAEETYSVDEKRMELEAEQCVSLQRRHSLRAKVATLPVPLGNSAQRHDERVGVDSCRMCWTLSPPRTFPSSSGFRSTSCQSSNARKKLTKTRKKSASNLPSSRKFSHGYLRANSLPPGATCAIPNASTSSQASEESKPTVVIQRHQHIHHHYYYHRKPAS